MADRKQIARQLYEAFPAGDRDFFERCWPGAGRGQEIGILRLIESGDEVVVTYELRRPDGSGGRNTEVLTFDGERVKRIEVYFGWDR